MHKSDNQAEALRSLDEVYNQLHEEITKNKSIEFNQGIIQVFEAFLLCFISSEFHGIVNDVVSTYLCSSLCFYTCHVIF